MATIDARVRDILRVKLWLGLLDRPYVSDPAAADWIGRVPEHLAIAERAAHESIVLLKNDGATLPLRKDVKRVLVVGPLADNAHGLWSRYGPQQLEFVTPFAAIREKLGAAVDVRYAQGCAVTDERFPESDVYREPPTEKARTGIAAAVAAAKEVDEVVAVLGETGEISQELVRSASICRATKRISSKRCRRRASRSCSC